MKKSHMAWPLVEILTTASLSFFGSFIFSLFAFMMLLQVEGEGGPGDGIGFVVVLFFVIPIWLALAVIGTIYSNIKFTREQDFLKRVGFTAIVPIIVSTITSALVTITLLN